jgi:cbb3-type cytochrome oxidase subunit 3
MKPFTTLAIVIFSLMCLAHVLRLLFGWEVIFDGYRVPLWISPLAAVVTGVIAYMLWREARGE